MNTSDYAVTAVLSTALTLLLVAPCAYWFAQRSPSGSATVATVDVQLLLLEAQDALRSSSGNVNGALPARLPALSAGDFARRLSTAVAVVGLECDCVIVNKAAVLGGNVVDYTDHIRERLR